MPRSVQEILDHADALALKFENYEPSPHDEIDSDAVALLREAAALRAQAEKSIVEAVLSARIKGLSWNAIGTLLGTSGEAARQRYGNAA